MAKLRKKRIKIKKAKHGVEVVVNTAPKKAEPIFQLGSEVEVLCLGDRGVKHGRRHGTYPPEVAYVRAAKITDRFDKGVNIRAVDADGVQYWIKVIQKTGDAPRAKVTSERWSVCHLLDNPDQGRAIIELTVERLNRWHARMDRAERLSTELGHLRLMCDRELEAQQAEREALRAHNGTADLAKVFGLLPDAEA